MLIGGLQKNSLIDYPEKIACIVFLTGCNFRCRFCHNPELVLPKLIKKQPHIKEYIFFNFLKSRKKLLDGIVITGGEPTIHSGLSGFLKKIKKLGFLIKLDTNGTSPEVLKDLINAELIDYIAMDVKSSLNKEKYSQIVGMVVNIKNIKKSIEIIKNSKIEHEFRTTVVPSIHTPKDIIEIVKFVTPSKYFLQNFENPIGKVIDKKLQQDKKNLINIYKKIPKELNVKIKK